MFKKVSLLATALLFTAVTVHAQEGTPQEVSPYNCDYSPSCEVAPGVYGHMGSPVTSKFNLSIGGYVKLDYAHNSNGSGPTSQAGGTLPGNKQESIFSAKQSRFWLKVAGPAFLGAKTNALVEMDFYGANSLANEFANARLRHAMGTLDWKNTQLMFGQFWDIFGPGAIDTIDFRQGAETGAPNNPRVPQIRLTHNIGLGSGNGLKLVLGVQNPTQDRNSAGANAQPSTLASSYGDMVNVAGQVMFSSKALGVSPGFMGLGLAPLQVGFFGLYGSQKVPGNKALDSYGYGLYGFVPIIRSADGKHRTMSLSLETEGTLAYNIAVMQGTSNLLNTTSGAGITPLFGAAGNKEGTKGYNFYAQLKFYPTQNLGLTGGFGRRGAMDTSDWRTAVAENAGSTFEKYNQAYYANATYDINAAVRLATEYEHIERKFDKPVLGSNYAQNNIFRFAAYYFF